jgi:NADH-quinone oxidoreductase subunit N
MNPIQIAMPDLSVIGPHLLVAFTACVLLVLEAIRPKEGQRNFDTLLPIVGLSGLGLALGYLVMAWAAPLHSSFSGMVVLDRFGTFFNGIILAGTMLTVLVSMSYMKKENAAGGEFYVLVLLAAMGMMFMVTTNNLLMLFVALETMSIAIYVLAGYISRRLQCNESAMKYFFLGAFASAFLLYGMALLYGATGSLDLIEIGKARAGGNPIFLAGMALVLVGLGFKIASFPFHMWTPDVYDGAPVSVTGFMAVGVKAAAFAALVRIVLAVFPAVQTPGYWILWSMAILTMFVGNFSALAQTNIKRMLAYSSIAHTGYLLVGLTAMVGRTRSDAAEGILYYLLAYTFMNIGAFAVVAYLARKDETKFDIESFNGLSKINPKLALAMAIFMFSLAGIPPLAGFFGKFYVFQAAVKANLLDLAIIGVLNSAISVYYYIRIVWYMYFREPAEGQQPYATEGGNSLALIIAVIFTLLLGILPAFWITLAKQSVMTVVSGF